ncbi:MAG: hypothetical protein HZC37_07745 [Burkholderiales bacterium]|nr:hypothetical protein [Burkholderiales bacterium]
MPHSTPEHNPFMLLVHPEAVFAAMEKSERLGRLNRHLCRPLDRPVGPQTAPAASGEDEADDDLSDVVTTPQ